MEKDDRIGQKLGNYNLRRVLGKGGFATVYLGEHVAFGSKGQAAVKVMKTVTLTDQARDQFLKEARTIARLTHPNIIHVITCGIDIQQDSRTPYIAMSYASKGNIYQEYPQGTILPFDVVLSYVKQSAAALQYAHDQNIVHCDVKPENILLGGPRQILLADFGIANVSHTAEIGMVRNDIYTDPTAAGDEIQGTVTYMAPERFQNLIRRSSDQYSLGVVVYEWLTGNPPFTGSHQNIIYQHLNAPPPPLRAKNPQVSPELEQVVLKALEKEPTNRYESVKEFAEALEKAISSSYTPAPSTTARTSTPTLVKQELSEVPTEPRLSPRSKPEIAEPLSQPVDAQFSSVQSVEDPPDSPLAPLPSLERVNPSGQIEMQLDLRASTSSFDQNLPLATPPQEDDPGGQDSIKVQPLIVEDAIAYKGTTFRTPPPLPAEDEDEAIPSAFSIVDTSTNGRSRFGPSSSAEEENVAEPRAREETFSPPEPLEDDPATLRPSSLEIEDEYDLTLKPVPEAFSLPEYDPAVTPTPGPFSLPEDDLAAGLIPGPFSLSEDDPVIRSVPGSFISPEDDPVARSAAQPSPSMSSSSFGSPLLANTGSNWNAQAVGYTGQGYIGGGSAGAGGGKGTGGGGSVGGTWSGGTSNIPHVPGYLDRGRGALINDEDRPSLFAGSGTLLGNLLESDFARQREWSRFRQAGLMANFLSSIVFGLIAHSLSIFLLGFLTVFAFLLCIRLVKLYTSIPISLLIALYWGYFGFSLTAWLLKFPVLSTLPIPLLIGVIFFSGSIGLHIYYLIRRLI